MPKALSNITDLDLNASISSSNPITEKAVFEIVHTGQTDFREPRSMGSYLYTTSASSPSGFRIFEWRDKSNPVLLGTWLGPGVVEAFPYGDRYVVTATEDDLRIIDVSNPSAPANVKSVEIWDGGNALVRGLYVSGCFAYVGGNQYGKLVIFDIHDPLNPVRVSETTFAASGRPGPLYVSGDLLFIGDDLAVSTLIFDVSDPSAPVLIYSIAAFGLAQADFTDDYAYVAYGSGVGGIDTTDTASFPVTNPVIAQTGVEVVFSVRVVGDLLLVPLRNSSLGKNFLRVYDITVRNSPVLISTTELSSSAGNTGPIIGTPSGRFLPLHLTQVAEAVNNTFILDIGGVTASGIEAESIETGHLNVQNEIRGARGLLSASLNVGSGGISCTGEICSPTVTTDTLEAGSTEVSVYKQGSVGTSTITPAFRRESGTTTTTDATPKTILTVSMPTSSAINVMFTAIGYLNTTGAVGVSKMATFLNDSGTVSQVGASTSIHGVATVIAGADILFNINGTDVEMQVQGQAATTLGWSGTIEVMTNHL